TEQRRMPDMAIHAETATDPVQPPQQQQAENEYRQQTGNQRAEKRQFTRHKPPPRPWRTTYREACSGPVPIAGPAAPGAIRADAATRAHRFLHRPRAWR